MSTLTIVGTGYLGARLMRARPSAKGINRSQPDGVDAERMALVDLEDELPPLPPCDAMIYTVAPDADGKRLRNLLDALDELPTRFVYISTTGVYGNRDGARVTEDDPVDPATERAKRRVAAEEELSERFSGDALTILRVPGIYGPGRIGLERLRDGEPLLREEDASPGNRIHVDDLARICLAAADTSSTSGTFNVGDGDNRSGTAFSIEVAKQAGIPVPETISVEEATEKFSDMRLSFLKESRVVDTTKLAALGADIRYTRFEDGIRASLEEMRRG